MASTQSSTISRAQAGNEFNQKHSTFCTPGRNKIQRQLGPAIFLYHEKRKTGLIPQNQRARFGYEDPRQRAETRIHHEGVHVSMSFDIIEWSRGYTGRGVDPRHDRASGHIGPMGENLDSLACAETPTPPFERSLWKAVDTGDDKRIASLRGGSSIHKNGDSSGKNDDDIGSSGNVAVSNIAFSHIAFNNKVEPRDEVEQHAQSKASNARATQQAIAAEALKISGEGASQLLTARAGDTEILGQMTKNGRSQEDSKVENLSSLISRGTKRSRGNRSVCSKAEDLVDQDWQPLQKRVRLERPDEAWDRESQRSDTSAYTYAKSSSDKLHSSTTDASSIDIRPSKTSYSRKLEGMRTKARPTFGSTNIGHRNAEKETGTVADNNEVDDIVVTTVTDVGPREHEYPPGLPPRMQPVPRPWTEDEEEDLRSWVQDYAIKENWNEIAWCLHRAVDDCQIQYREVVMARNERAGRDLLAGLPGWVDTELELTPKEIAQLRAEDISRAEAARKERAQKADIAGQRRNKAAEDGRDAGQEPRTAESSGKSMRRAQKPSDSASTSTTDKKRSREPETESELVAARQPAAKKRAAYCVTPSSATDPTRVADAQTQAAKTTPVKAAARPAAQKTFSNRRSRPRDANKDLKQSNCDPLRSNGKVKSVPQKTEAGTLIDAKDIFMNERGLRITGSQYPESEREKLGASEAPPVGDEGEERHGEAEALGAVKAAEEETWRSQRAAIRNLRHAETDYVPMEHAMDNERGEQAADRVARYRHRHGSPSDDGSQGGIVVAQGPVVEQLQGGARGFGVDRRAGRGRRW